MFELILKTDSKVLSTNLADFEAQANQYLAGLTTSFESDDDFAKAEDEVKQLKEIEDKTRSAIKAVLDGSAEVSAILQTAEEIAERFRKERLDREKLVKSRKEAIKDEHIIAALSDVSAVVDGLTTQQVVKSALNITCPQRMINARITDCTKNKRTIDGLTKALNGEKALLISELSAEVARLNSRLAQIPKDLSHLFNDAVDLIASSDDLDEVINHRVEQDKQRQEAIRAAEEAKEAAKRQAEQASATGPAKEATQEMRQKPEPTNDAQEDDGEVFDFMLQVPFRGSIGQARVYFEPVKALNFEGIKLIKL